MSHREVPSLLRWRLANSRLSIRPSGRSLVHSSGDKHYHITWDFSTELLPMDPQDLPQVFSCMAQRQAFGAVVDAVLRSR